MAEEAVAVESAVGTRSTLRCVASTGDIYRCTVDEAHPGWAHLVHGHATRADKDESNCFRHALLSSDGTAVITYNEDLILRTFAVPSVLDPDEKPTEVSPYCSAPSPSKLTSLILHPAFDVTNPATTLLLTSQPDLPIRLTNALDFTYTHASYTWQNHLTEAYISPSSLLFVDNDHFVAGAKDTLAVFNIHSHDGPVYESATRKGRKARKLYGADTSGIGGIVSSLALSNDNILAAGTYNRQVGLFENAGQGESMTAFDLSYNDADDNLLRGNGVSQLAWSPCGNYLFVAERQSDVLLVYDIRHTGQRLSYLAGRKALTTLKLSFDLASDVYGKTDVWAGGTDGQVRIWRDVTSRQGRVEPDLAIHASNAAVNNTILSRREPMLITTTGQRRSPSHLVGLDDSSSDSDSSSSEDDTDSSASEDDSDQEQCESDREESDQTEAQGETPASGIASSGAVEHSSRGSAFDNVLSFWRIL